MRNSTQLNGFDYRLGRAVTLTMGSWRSEIKQVEERGGNARRVVRGGDLQVFDDKGKMLFEVYDKDEESEVEGEAA